MKKWIFSLSLLLSLQTYAQVDEGYGDSQDKHLAGRWFKVLSETESLLRLGSSQLRLMKKENIKALIWNIKKAELAEWEKEFRTFASGRDLLLVQEAYQTDRFQAVIQSFNFRWDLGASFFYRQYGDRATGTMVGSQVEPTAALVKHSPDTEPITSTPKSLTIAKFPLEDSQEELLVISIHAINFETTGAFKRNMEVARAQIQGHQGPVLFAGDFNTWNASRTGHLFNLARQLGLAPVEFKNGDSRLTFRGYFLDHAFVRGLKVEKAEVIPDSRGSDHRPMLMEMSVL